MIRILVCAFAVATSALQGQTEGAAAGKSTHGRPATIKTSDLKDFETLPPARKKLIERAIAVSRDSGWLPYLFGGSTPQAGGFDCSGAVCFVLKGVGLNPPRTSADLFLWLRKEGRLHEVSGTAKSLEDESLKQLRPGDLLFWSGTYAPTDGRKVNISHVAIYLGREKKDGLHVMINSTDGRSYRGTKANGYGVYDFRLPKSTGKSRFLGYGTPPGIGETP